MVKILLSLIFLYQKGISPFLGNNCRFYPTCSEYMAEALGKYGIKGILTGIKRISRCHPFNRGGIDPLI